MAPLVRQYVRFFI